MANFRAGILPLHPTPPQSALVKSLKRTPGMGLSLRMTMIQTTTLLLISFSTRRGEVDSRFTASTSILSAMHGSVSERRSVASPIGCHQPHAKSPSARLSWLMASGRSAPLAISSIPTSSWAPSLHTSTRSVSVSEPAVLLRTLAGADRSLPNT